MTTIIRAEAAHDFLALVPALAGYRPARSVLCIAFTGNRTAGVLRHDLPADDQAVEPLVDAMVGTLCRMARVDAVVPVVYTDDAVADGGLPYARLLGELVRCSERAGFLVRDALCVAADGWGSVLDDELPAGGRPLELISSSAVATGTDALGPVAVSPASLVELPEPDPETSREVARLLRLFGGDGGHDEHSTDAAGGTALEEVERVLGAMLDPVVAAECLAEDGPVGRTPAGLAWFVHLAGAPSVRDAMMLQVAFGPVIGELALDSAEDAAERSRRSGSSLDETVRAEWESGGAESVDEFLTRLLMGRTTARPDADRIERALGTLVAAIANAPLERRAGPLCVAAWLAWALGRGSAAGALADRALACDPEHGMSQLLVRWFGTGALPEWAFHPSAASDEEARPISAR